MAPNALIRFFHCRLHNSSDEHYGVGASPVRDITDVDVPGLVSQPSSSFSLCHFGKHLKSVNMGISSLKHTHPAPAKCNLPPKAVPDQSRFTLNLPLSINSPREHSGILEEMILDIVEVETKMKMWKPTNQRAVKRLLSKETLLGYDSPTPIKIHKIFQSKQWLRVPSEESETESSRWGIWCEYHRRTLSGIMLAAITMPKTQYKRGQSGKAKTLFI
ncbi:hypothetical protein C8F04DRAFT_1183062 [Mycena alexandri]|uniref:Uncharacterized protein n=1 Tax=Mycena alexandri TaxID=1745969 RepID=A0AAD6SUX6_9AGAR|nr:hypothetical protein C8F04DRAFT_1183062 [Mycena alexandri]